jgi:hypothetical protein
VHARVVAAGKSLDASQDFGWHVAHGLDGLVLGGSDDPGGPLLGGGDRGCRAPLGGGDNGCRMRPKATP